MTIGALAADCSESMRAAVQSAPGTTICSSRPRPSRCHEATGGVVALDCQVNDTRMPCLPDLFLGEPSPPSCDGAVRAPACWTYRPSVTTKVCACVRVQKMSYAWPISKMDAQNVLDEDARPAPLTSRAWISSSVYSTYLVQLWGRYVPMSLLCCCGLSWTVSQKIS